MWDSFIFANSRRTTMSHMNYMDYSLDAKYISFISLQTSTFLWISYECPMYWRMCRQRWRYDVGFLTIYFVRLFSVCRMAPLSEFTSSDEPIQSHPDDRRALHFQLQPMLVDGTDFVYASDLKAQVTATFACTNERKPFEKATIWKLLNHVDRIELAQN